ncbi:hypothetical protein [Spectribacter hydrogenoxidans]|uniref:Uncharacterized protein n=1 Tax=Spectribacter hydrogenoxidans TaxID=3075608 RepID=A0ABU3BZZ3_9GAMM|nr:hypothetical protein [Salinisphaera sp. W335]MDT0634875.1 hypothetical protein [Salinisphaera sp. W335]
MEALLIIGALITLLGIVASIPAINSFSEERYLYRPFNVANALGVCLIYVLLAAALLFNSNHEGNEFVLNLNVKVFLASAMLYALGMLVNLSRKSNVLIALYAFVITSVLALPILAIGVMLIGNIVDRKR